MKPPVARRIRLAFDTLLPAACVGCGRAVGPDVPPLCAPCDSRLPALPRPRCERCAEPLGAIPRGAPFRRCGTCEEWPATLAGAEAPFVFDGGGATVVRALKYGRWTTLAPRMACAMDPPARGLLARLGWHPGHTSLVPVPLAPARLRERGFNQADLLARALAGTLGLPVLDVLRREPGGRRQARLGGAARLANVRGRFVARRGSPDPLARALLVDDVMTTGATALACAEALREAGFERAALITFARTPRPLAGRRPLRRAGGSIRGAGRHDPRIFVDAR